MILELLFVILSFLMMKRSVPFDVSFQIEPFKGKANCYTIYKPHKVTRDHIQDPISDPHRLNHKYQEKLHGWTAERRQRKTGTYDMYYSHKDKKCRSIPDVQKYIFNGFLMLEVNQETNEVKEVGAIEKCSMKRKEERSILIRESTIKKHKNNNYDQSEVKKFVANGRCYLNNWSWHRSSRASRIQQLIGDLVGDVGGEASNDGSYVVTEFVTDGRNKLNWCWQRQGPRGSQIQQIMGGLVGNNSGGASNGAAVKQIDDDGRNKLNWVGIRSHEVHGFNKLWEALLATTVVELVMMDFFVCMEYDKGRVSDAKGGGSARGKDSDRI